MVCSNSGGSSAQSTAMYLSVTFPQWNEQIYMLKATPTLLGIFALNDEAALMKGVAES